MLMVKYAEQAKGNKSLMAMASRRPFSDEKQLAICFCDVLSCIFFFLISQGINCFEAIDFLHGI